MVTTNRQNVLIETHALRQQAVEVLSWLEESRAQIEAQLKAEQRTDMVRLVAGRSSLDQAILDTKRVIESLDRAMSEARRTGEHPSQHALCGSVQVVSRVGSMFGLVRSA